MRFVDLEYTKLPRRLLKVTTGSRSVIGLWRTSHVCSGVAPAHIDYRNLLRRISLPAPLRPPAFHSYGS